MSDSADPPAGGASGSRGESAVLRQFVMEYLQSHGFDKALEMFRQGIAADGAGDAGEAAGAGPSTTDGSLHREAIVRAPEPVPIESTLKRNIPQAQTTSASTLSDRITPEFEAQAKYIIEQLTKSAETRATNTIPPGADEDADDIGGNSKEMLLDISDRVEGYRRYRRWVDDGLDLWKTELDGVSFPLFVYTYLELIGSGFTRAARNFFASNRAHHDDLHHQEIVTLSSVSTKYHVASNSLCQRLLGGKYTVTMSRNSHDLLLQWLSGAGLDDGWEAGLQTAAGRAKEAVKRIIYSHINLTVAQQPMPFDKASLIASSGLLSDLVGRQTVQSFNSSTPLKLGPAPITDKLREQVLRTIQDEDAEVNGTSSAPPDGAGGADGDQVPNGDVDMSGSPAGGGRGSTAPAKSPSASAMPEVKVEPEPEDSDLVSPEEGETIPPVPAVFKIADLKREVEAIRDKRKMIRLGAGASMGEGKGGPSTVLPSVVAFTVFDSGEGISSLEFSQDASLMAAGSSESSVRIWSLKNEKLKAKSIDGTLREDEGLPMRKLIGHSGPVYGLSFDPIYGTSQAPGSLLTSSQDGTVRLWSLDTYTNLVVYRGHARDPVWDVTWGPMGAYFATASRDRTARLWSSDRVTPLRMYTGHLSDVNTVKFHPNSLYLATGSNDNSCRLWDVQRGACIRLFMGHTDAVTCLAVSPDGRTLASADSNIWLWDLGSSRPVKKMTGHRGPIYTLSWSAESNLLVSGGSDSTVRVWDAKSAGGERRGSTRGVGANGELGRAGTAEHLGVSGMERGGLPMGSGEVREEGESTSDLLSTFRTKRTPIIKAHYTPRNLCMVAGTFVPPSNSVVQEA